MFDSLHSKKKEHYAERKEEINEELQKLLAEIKHLQSKTNEVNVFNQKITFIETLMAEQSTEAELMKKYYYNISSNKLKGKIGDFNHLRTRVGDAYKSLPHYDNKNKKGKNQLYPKDIITKKPLFKETTSNSLINKISLLTSRLISQTMSPTGTGKSAHHSTCSLCLAHPISATSSISNHSPMKRSSIVITIPTIPTPKLGWAVSTGRTTRT
jgi:hypothetical protein